MGQAQPKPCKHCGNQTLGDECDPCIEKIKSRDTFPCKYESKRCRIRMTWAQLKVHEKYCKYRKMTCDNPYDCITCTSVD